MPSAPHHHKNSSSSPSRSAWPRSSAERGAQQPTRGHLAPLHIAAEPFEKRCWQCLIGKPDHDRPSWVAQLRARLQVKLAELVEGGDRPVCTGPHATEPGTGSVPARATEIG